MLQFACTCRSNRTSIIRAIVPNGTSALACDAPTPPLPFPPVLFNISNEVTNETKGLKI